MAGGSIAVWDATGQRREFRGDVRAVTALVADEQYLYCADVSGIRRFRLNDGASVPFNGGTAAIPTEPGAVRAMDVAGSTLYVADARTGTVRMFDTESGRPTGDFPTPLPTAVAIDAIGQTWVPTTAAASARIAPTAIRA